MRADYERLLVPFGGGGALIVMTMIVMTMVRTCYYSRLQYSTHEEGFINLVFYIDWATNTWSSLRTRLPLPLLLLLLLLYFSAQMEESAQPIV